MVYIVWATPPVFSDGNLLTASQLNTLSGDLNETAAGLATTAGSFFAADGVNSLAERIPDTDTVGTTESNASTSYVNLTTGGPDAACTSGSTTLLILTSGQRNTAVDAETYYAWSVSGATTVAANDSEALRHTSSTAGAELNATWALLITGLTPGLHNYRSKYRVTSGTGTWWDRRITVVPY